MAEVFAISVQSVKGEVELCHLTMVPVWPESVKSPLVLPKQIVVPPVTVPPTDIGSTITVVSGEFSAAQTPRWTVARNLVVWASGFET